MSRIDIRTVVYPYIYAALATLGAFGATYAVWPLVKLSPLALFYGAVAVVAGWWGLSPGLVTTALAGILGYVVLLGFHHERIITMEKHQPPSPKYRPYDAEMISDFVHQLLWELRVRHFEHVSPGADNPELVDNMLRFNKKRSSMGLLWVHKTREEDEPFTDEEIREYHRIAAGQTQAQIYALELLMAGPLNEAIKQASMPGVILMANIDLRATIDAHRNQDPPV
jgi:hypothetical protein